MYFSNKNNFFHGIMFHHFHDDKLHKKSQGSISKDVLYKIIKFLGRENILDAKDFLLRFKENKLKEKDLCFTFDDGIKSQYDVALPVLEDLKIKGFFFIYSSLLEAKPDLLEVYRYFRTNYFKDIDEFYENFFSKCNLNLENFFKNNEKIIKSKKIKYPFYSINDIKFRLIRDNLMDKEKYEKIMLEMFAEKNFKEKKEFNNLFMNKENLINLKQSGHQIGLHSHSHHTNFKKLDYKTQYSEYDKNLNILTKNLNCNKNEIVSMSHPCGSYNDDSLKVLEKLGVELGFKNIMDVKDNIDKSDNSKFEIAREDHANIIKLMNQ